MRVRIHGFGHDRTPRAFDSSIRKCLLQFGHFSEAHHRLQTSVSRDEYTGVQHRHSNAVRDDIGSQNHTLKARGHNSIIVVIIIGSIHFQGFIALDVVRGGDLFAVHLEIQIALVINLEGHFIGINFVWNVEVENGGQFDFWHGFLRDLLRFQVWVKRPSVCQILEIRVQGLGTGLACLQFTEVAFTVSWFGKNMDAMILFMTKHIIEVTMLTLGLLTVLASVRNWNFLFDYSGRDVLASLTSRLGSRIVYGTLGGLMTVASLLSALR
jgi:hypothetical protein